MNNIRDLMQTRVVTVAPWDPLDRARELMALHGIRHLPVVAHGSVVGVVSQRDVWASRRDEEGDEEARGTDEVTVERIMNRPVATLDPDAVIGRAHVLLRRRSVGCIPVVENGELVGIVTRSDLRSYSERPFEQGRVS